MSDLFLDNPYLLILLLSLFSFCLIFLALYLREYEKRKATEKENDKIFSQMQDRASYILDKTLSKARTILETAAVEEVQIINTSKDQVRKIEDSYAQFLEDLKKRSIDYEKDSQDALKQETLKGLERIEQNLADFLNSTQQQSIGSIQLEIQASRQLIDTYKRRQLQLIDENIIAILEKAMGLVLAKRLSLKEHMDLVYEALEKAKAEKFIV